MRSGVVLRRFAGEAILDRVRSMQCRTYWWGERDGKARLYKPERGIVPVCTVCR